MEYEKTYEEQVEWEKLAEEHAISAREYFYILRLALYHVDGLKTDNSYEVAQAYKSAEVYACACNIIKALYKEKKCKNK